METFFPDNAKYVLVKTTPKELRLVADALENLLKYGGRYVAFKCNDSIEFTFNDELLTKELEDGCYKDQ